MKRRNFLRNALVGMAFSILPEILRPSTMWIAGDVVPTPPVYSNTDIYAIPFGDGTMWASGEYLNKVRELNNQLFSN